MKNVIQIARDWNAAALESDSQTPLSQAELGGRPLSMHERAHLEGNTYQIRITLKAGSKKSMRLVASRGIDAFLEMCLIAETEGWDEQIRHVDIESIDGKFS